MVNEAFINSLFDDTEMFVSSESAVNSVVAEGADHDSGDAVREGTTDISAIDQWVPEEGMIVDSVIDGFIMYSDYARRNGFEVRFRSSDVLPSVKRAEVEAGELVGRRVPMKRGISRTWFHRGYENCYRVRLQCVKGDKCRSRKMDPNRPVRTQCTECKASVTLLKNDESKWVLKKVVVDHNHELDISNSRFMKNYRMVSGEDDLQMVTADRAGVGPSRNYATFVVGNGGVRNVPFSMDDFRNIIRHSRSVGMLSGDFHAMQNLFNEMRDKSEDFFYMYDIDDEGRLKNVFWADGRSRAAYRDFHDVICFDTTHLRNRYKMPLAPFIGVNHHGQSILLGCALLSREDTESFVWVFESWLKCMEGNAPKYVMTDQCQAIGNAIAATFPDAVHRWCLWHVMRNADRHLRRCGDWDEIRTCLKEAVHDSYDPFEFESKWFEFVRRFGLEGNEWLGTMFEARERWVPVYFMHQFWVGLNSTQRSEGMNNFFRSYVNINTGLRQFLEQYCLAVGKRVDDEAKENWKSLNRPVQCATRFISEAVFQKIYTTNKFLECQKEVKGVAYISVTRVIATTGVNIYNVVDRGVEKAYGGVVTRRFRVRFVKESNDSEFSCKLFKFRGIVCRHIIGTWQEEEVKEVPCKYIVDRWRKDIFRESSIIEIPNYTHQVPLTSEQQKLQEYRREIRDIQNLACGNLELIDYMVSGVKSLKEKCKSMVVNGEDSIRVDSVGRIFRRVGSTENVVEEIPDGNVVNVLDPVDRRGRGRMAMHRKGYQSEKRSCKSKKSRSGKKNKGKSSKRKQNVQEHNGGWTELTLGNFQCQALLPSTSNGQYESGFTFFA